MGSCIDDVINLQAKRLRPGSSDKRQVCHLGELREARLAGDMAMDICFNLMTIRILVRVAFPGGERCRRLPFHKAMIY